jgi:hypothetical protein
MTNAGYAQSRYTIMIQTYPSPLPRGDTIRYGETSAERHLAGGCEFWNVDANWANDVALVKIIEAVKAAAASVAGNVMVLDVSSAFNGRRLCERGVGTLEEQGLLSWTASGAADKTEWVERIRVETGVTGTPYFIQESLHPNWWGELALRNCVRQAYNNGSPQGGTCTRLDGLNAGGEPNMLFAGSGAATPLPGATTTTAAPTTGVTVAPGGAVDPAAPVVTISGELPATR